jgi:hypothetical protein
MRDFPRRPTGNLGRDRERTEIPEPWVPVDCDHHGDDCYCQDEDDD